MKGAARAAARRADENTLQAYQVLTFYALAQKGRLKPVAEFLIEKPKRRMQSPDEMLSILRGMAGSAKMNIRQVN
jgi:hypothetical protein